MTDAAFDLAVIGGGSGGIACARRAASHGARVVLIEKGALGGTCVNLGCVPKKVMWHASGFAQAMQDAPGYGFEVTRGELDWDGLRKKRDAYVRRLNSIYADGLQRDQVEVIDGHGQLAGPNSVRVGDRVIEARQILLATGGHPIRPEIPGAELGMVSDDFFRIRHCPRTIAVVGSGYIAVELAGMLQALGARVSLLIRKTSVLREFDESLGTALLEHMADAGIDVRMQTSVTELAAVGDAEGDGVRATLSDGSEAEWDAVLWAIGRAPSTTDLGLDEAGVEQDASGFVPTDAFQTSNIHTIHAVGDMTGRAALTPVAIAAGRRLADRLFAGADGRHLDYSNIPTVVFSHPPVGTVGQSEAAALESGVRPVRVYEARFNALYYGILEDKHPTLVKMVTAGENERVVGCHVVGDGADEMMQGFAVAVRMGATKQDFDDTVAIHPTSAEEMVTLREPAREYAK